MSQQLRPSQYVTTFGPGSIIETPVGPGVLPSLVGSGLFARESPLTFEITATRLEAILGPTAGVVRIPTNAELRLPEQRRAGLLVPFPMWSLCTLHSIVYRADQRCPRCTVARGREEAIRFVLACTRGHLDDVRWPRLMEHRGQDHEPSHLLWEGSGALRNITIRCPDCDAPRSLGDAYNRPTRCSGRYPERGTDRPGCAAPAHMTQRGAANLRVAELATALTIPPRDSELYLLLRRTDVDVALRVSGARTKSALVEALGRLGGRTPQDVITALAAFPDNRVEEAITEVLGERPPGDQETLLLEELAALRDGAAYGAPPVAGADGRGERQFQMPLSMQIEFDLPVGRLRGAAVTRLRVVSAQRGYRRVDPANADLVPSTSEIDGRTWFPGMEVFGEGIFLYPTASIVPAERARRRATVIHAPVERLWWHTLSHRLIRVIGRDAGYGSAAIRERVYAVDPIEAGGLLLYTAQPGGDGTLGGLAALTGDLPAIVRSALDDLDGCSNDPLCGDRPIGPTDVNGAACYACAFVSETSCDHRNVGLDRVALMP